MPEFSEESLRNIAREKVHKRLAVEIHLTAYVMVSLLLAVINLFTSPAYWWFLWPLCSWAIGITMHVTSYVTWLVGVTGRKIGVVYHTTAYFSVNLFLVFVWWFTTHGLGFMWFVFPLFGWAIGLAFHYMAVRASALDQKLGVELKTSMESENLSTGKMPPAARYCASCGAQIHPGASFCDLCGEGV